MKKISLLLAVLLVTSAVLYGCGKKEEAPPPTASASESASMPTTEAEIVAHNLKIDESTINLIQLDPPAADAKTATIKTSAGDVKLVLYPQEAPKAVENFLALAEQGYYNGMKFYEVLPGVRVSTGDPDATGSGGKSSFADGALFEDEYSLNLWHFNGAVAMDNGGTSGANGSRFYIVQNSEITDALAGDMLDAGYPEKVVNKYLSTGGVPNYDAKDTVFAQVVEGMDVIEKIAAAPRDDNHKPTEDITITEITVA